MHICELVRLMPVHSPGGMQTHAAVLARALVRQGHRVTLLTAERPGVDEEVVDGVRVVYVPGARPERHSPAGWEALNRAWDALNARDPFDLVHAHSSAGEGWAKQRRPHAPPLVVTMHGTHWGEWLTSMRSLRGRPVGRLKSTLYMWWFYGVVAATYLPRARAMIFTGATDFRRGRFFYPLPRRREMIPTGVDTGCFRPDVPPVDLRAELGLDPRRPLVLGAGRMMREKGWATAIEAIPRWQGPPPYLVLLGDGPDLAELRRYAEALSAGAHVKFHPAVTREQLPSYLTAADLYLFPTWREEGSPNALVEAMACGLPIVASDLGAVRDIAPRDEAALLVPKMNAEALRGAMARLLGDRELAQRLGQTARRRVVEQFSAERMAARTAQLFGELVAGATGP
jgi:glycosyltransferase involved in cell wall biosynthesis